MVLVGVLDGFGSIYVIAAWLYLAILHRQFFMNQLFEIGNSQPCTWHSCFVGVTLAWGWITRSLTLESPISRQLNCPSKTSGPTRMLISIWNAVARLEECVNMTWRLSNANKDDQIRCSIDETAENCYVDSQTILVFWAASSGTPPMSLW